VVISCLGSYKKSSRRSAGFLPLVISFKAGVLNFVSSSLTMDALLIFLFALLGIVIAVGIAGFAQMLRTQKLQGKSSNI